MLKRIDNAHLDCIWSDFHDVQIQFDDGKWFKKNDPKIRSFTRRKRKPVNISVKFVVTLVVGKLAQIVPIEPHRSDRIIPIENDSLNIDELIAEESYNVLAEIRNEAKDEPFCIKSNLHVLDEWYWLYDGIYYRDTDHLKSAEVKALVLTRKKMRQARLNRALTIANTPETPIEEQRRGYIPEDIRLLVWERDGGKCVKCGARNELQFDHIIPFSVGGSSTESNLQILCGTCNRAKSNSVA